MAKLKPLKHREVVDILKNNGYKLDRAPRHEIYKKHVGDKVITVPVPRPHNYPIAVFIIKNIVRKTGKPREEFY